jgi:hypothetical protein
MKHNEKNVQASLEQAVTEMREQQPEAGTIRSASERVWKNLRQEIAAEPRVATSIRGCDDVRSLLPQYRSGQLSPARALLVEAHLHECVACRRVAETGRRLSPADVPWQHELPRATNDSFRWMAAAAAVVLIAVSAYFVQDRFFASPAGMRARVDSLSGALYRVGFSGESALKAGDVLAEGERVRTAGDSRAVLRLADGSVVEMNERSEFAVSMRRKDTTIQLGRGNIIVQAAKRKTGHLYVAAKDCRVSVTGTVFSVNSGMKGSRVSVIEGEVRVASAGANSVLHPGDQLSTSFAVGSVPVEKEIAWSQDLDKHLALLAEFSHLFHKLEAVQMPGLRYQSNLLSKLPSSTVLYASIPNLGDAAQQANQLFQQELQESQVLREWWQQAQAQNTGYNFQDAIDEFHSLSGYLGDEMVFTVALDGRRGSPLIVAQVQRPGLKDFINGEISKHGSGQEVHLRVVDEQGLNSLPAQDQEKRDLLVLVRPDFVAASSNAGTLQNFVAALNHGGGGFAATAFGQRMLATYTHGVGLLFGANLQVMASQHLAHQAAHPHPQVFQQTGFADVQYLVAERKDNGGHPLNHAELSFTGPRRGFASWLAAPAPLGGLDFVSRDAGAVISFVAKSPSQMLDDVLSVAGIANPNAQSDFNREESELRISFRRDLAETLGGEATLALDGPILPTPSWKLIAEVYDPGRLQSTIQQLVADANEHAQKPEYHVTVEQESVNGLTYYRLRFQDSNKAAEVDYTFVDGYLVMAPSRALVMTAINIRQGGNSLAQSNDFKALLPPDENANVSALVYQNLSPVIGPVMQQLTPSQLQALQQIAAETKPSLVCAYGEKDAIRVASTSRFFGLDLNTAALSALLKLTHPQQRGAQF